MRLQRLHNLEVTFSAFSARSAENARRAKDDLFGVQNSRKASGGELAGILDPSLMQKKVSDERRLRGLVASDPQLEEAADAWSRIEQAQKTIADHALTYNLLEAGPWVCRKPFRHRSHHPARGGREAQS